MQMSGQFQRDYRGGSRGGSGGFGAEPRQIQRGCKESSREGLGYFGAFTIRPSSQETATWPWKRGRQMPQVFPRASSEVKGT